MPRNSTNYNIAGTLSFRLGSRKILHRWGTNLQNIEKSARKMYIPDPGKIFVQCDQSGAEALIVAYLCEKGQFRDLFLCGVKPHVFVALHVFTEELREVFLASGADTQPKLDELVNTPIPQLKSHRDWKEVELMIKESDKWPPSKRYYYIAKMICHASNYGMRASAFQLNVLEKSRGQIVLSKKEAENYLTIYHSLFPEIHAWHRDVEMQLKETHYLFNLFGYPRYFFFPEDYPPDTLLKEAYAQAPQSTVACITHIAYTRAQNYIESEKLDWDLLANTHDSYLFQCPIPEARQCATVARDFMNQELTSPRGEKFRMKSEVVAGFNWAPYDKDTNPEGLKDI